METCTFSRVSAIFRISAALQFPRYARGEWIIIMLCSGMMISSPAMATMEAADAAIPSTYTVIFASCL